jgi:hypothetical protein
MSKRKLSRARSARYRVNYLSAEKKSSFVNMLELPASDKSAKPSLQSELKMNAQIEEERGLVGGRLQSGLRT